ncbi:MAG: efflux RND transporter periplasmic adaptor subunit [Thermoanaerobaculia bacterium]
MIWMLGAVVLFVAAIGSIKFFQVKAAMASQGSYQPPPETVTTTVAKREMWDTTLTAIGTVEAVKGVTISADLPGVVQEISFESGRHVNAGDVLVRLDSRQEIAQLAAAEAQRDLARVNLERSRGLLAGQVIPQSTYDQAAAEFKSADARAGEIRATIARKTIRAPFSGTVGIRQVNVGQYLAGGTPIVSLQSLQPAYVNFTLPQQELSRLRSGTEVQATSDAMEGTVSGKINAIDSVVDETLRNVRVQAIFANTDNKLRPGMFVEAQLAKGNTMPVITLPVSSISYAPFGDSVFIVEDVKGPKGGTYRGVRQQFVKLGTGRGDLVAVLTGVKPGEEVVSSGVFKLRPGAAVQVDNKIQPGNNAAPKPEDS